MIRIPGGVKVTGTSPESNGAEGPYCGQPYDALCVPRGLVTFGGAAAAAAAAAAGLPAAEKFRLLCPVLGIAGAVAVCWPLP